MGQPYIVQAAFRYRNDNGSESGAGWMYAINTNGTVDVDTNFRMRFLIQNTGDKAQTGMLFRLEYNLAGGGWNPVTEASSVVISVDSSYFNDDDTTTQQLGVDADWTAGYMDDADGTGGITSAIGLVAGYETEVEYCVQIVSGDVSDGQSLELRVTINGDTLDNYAQTPDIEVNKAGTDYFEYPTDSVSVSDSIKLTLVKGATDSVDVADAVSGITVGKGLTDGVDVADTFSRVVTFVRNLADSVDVSDQVKHALTKALDDSVDVSDVFDYTILTVKELADSVDVSDAISKVEVVKSLSDSVDIADTFSRAVEYYRSFSDSVDVSDSLAIEIIKSLSDGVDIAEAIAGFVVEKGLTDSVDVADAIKRAITKALADGVDVSDLFDYVYVPGGLGGFYLVYNSTEKRTEMYADDVLIQSWENEGA